MFKQAIAALALTAALIGPALASDDFIAMSKGWRPSDDLCHAMAVAQAGLEVVTQSCGARLSPAGRDELKSLREARVAFAHTCSRWDKARRVFKFDFEVKLREEAKSGDKGHFSFCEALEMHLSDGFDNRRVSLFEHR